MNDINIKIFTFNGFGENTYVVYNEEKEAFIFDPGNSTPEEDRLLFDFISAKNLQPTALISTHCHIDHILGNATVLEEYDIPYWAPDGEQMLLESGPVLAEMYGIPYQPSPPPMKWIDTSHSVMLGQESWELISVPGHSPASMVFYLPQQEFLIGGDVLFRDSIGRTDLPGGNHEALLTNIREKLYVLPDQTIVYPGHGTTTTIGHEKKNNPFVRG